MKKWFYEVVECLTSEQKQRLREMGNNGWELVAVVPTQTDVSPSLSQTVMRPSVCLYFKADQ